MEVKNAILEYISENSTKEDEEEFQKVVITTVNMDSVDNIISSKSETTYQTTLTNVSGTYKSEEDARSAVISYINELKENNANINVSNSLKDENVFVKENYVDKITVSTLFASADLAMEYFNNLSDDNYTLKNAKATGIDKITTSDSSSSSTSGTSTTTENWGHLDIDATNKINIMASDGKTVIDTVTGYVTLTKVTVNNKTVSYNKKSYDTNRGAWEFVSSRNLSIKSGDTVVITGTISYTYNGKDYSLPFTYTGSLLTQNNVCEGKGDAKGYDLSVSSINVTDDNKVVIEVSTKYQLTYERYNYTVSVNVVEDVVNNTYTVNVPTMNKSVTDYSYKIVGSYTVKGYDYVVEFPYDIMEDRYSFEAMISHKSKPATKVIDVYEYYVQSIEILGKGGDVEDSDEILEVAPKTGNKGSLLNVMLLAVLFIIKKIFK